MQLLLVLALLLLGKGDDDFLKQAEPVLKDLGGEDLKNVLKEAQEISQMVSALGSAGSIFGETTKEQQTEGESGVNCPLAPIASIADKDITYCMTKYISEEN